nr:MAG TPA: hypothetical protein [Caudoviricetes sp.]
MRLLCFISNILHRVTLRGYAMYSTMLLLSLVIVYRIFYLIITFYRSRVLFST